MEYLNTKYSPEAIMRLSPDCFAINYEKFCSIYKDRTGSCTSVASIKNRLTRSKSGFYSLEVVPPQGYSKVYTHERWNVTSPILPNNIVPSIQSTTHPLMPFFISNQNPPAEPLITPSPPIQEPHSHIISNGSTMISEYTNPIKPTNEPPRTLETNRLITSSPATISEPVFEIPIPMIFNDELFLKTILPENTESVSLSEFCNSLKKIRQWDIEDSDIEDIKMLLSYGESSEFQIENNIDVVSRKMLREFGIRYGPWKEIIQNLREFVLDGARDWFVGKCDGDRAKELLCIHSSEECYYFIRSVGVNEELLPKHYYVFALSFIQNGNIFHLRIFKDHQNLCVVDEQKNIQRFSNLSKIIEWRFNKGSAKPLSHPNFKKLKTITPKQPKVELSHEYVWVEKH